MNIAQLMTDSHRTASEKGWHDSDRTIAEEIALMHSELSEALEEVRNPNVDNCAIYYSERDGHKKPEGVAAEFADVLIRIFDTCQHRDIPLLRALHEKMAFNETRPYRHGGKAL
jgi:NTP pyrophosphatase (non-canonical NTP hydrolase)